MIKKSIVMCICMMLLMVSTVAAIGDNNYLLELQLAKPSFNINEYVTATGGVTLNNKGIVGVPVTLVVQDERGKSILNIEQYTTSVNGSFQISFKMPTGITAGEYVMKVKSCGIESLKTFTITEDSTEPPYGITFELTKIVYKIGETIAGNGRITSNNAGVAATPVTISVLGPEEEEILRLDPINTDDNGYFQFSFNMPQGTNSGTYSIKIQAIGLMIMRTLRIYDHPAAKLDLQLSKASYRIDENVTGSGRFTLLDNGVLGELITLQLLDKEENLIQEILQTITNNSGHFQFSFRMPTGANPGTYKIKAKTPMVESVKSFTLYQPTEQDPPSVEAPVAPKTETGKIETYDTSYGSINITVSPDGIRQALVSINSEKLEASLTGSDPILINIDIDEAIDSLLINFNKELLQRAATGNKLLVIDLGFASFEIDLAGLLLGEGEDVVLQVSLLKEEERRNILNNADGSMKLVSEIYDFSFYQNSNNQQKKVTFNKPIVIRIPYNMDKIIDARKLGAYYFNPKGEWEYIGGRAEDDEFVFSVNHFSHYGILEFDKKFKDVNIPWAQEAIEVLAARHIIAGIDGENYSPNTQITRAQFAKLLVEALQFKQGNQTIQFIDVPEGQWFSEYVKIAASLGIVVGSDGRFKPNQPITREEMAVMLMRTLELVDYTHDSALIENRIFTDEWFVASWAIEAVKVASSQGLLKGVGQDKFAPKDKITRAQAAVIIFRLMEKLALI